MQRRGRSGDDRKIVRLQPRVPPRECTGGRLSEVLFEPPRSTKIRLMGKLFNKIREAVANDRFVVSWHADERCEERGVTAWQLVAGLQDAELVRERPRSKPLPSVVVRSELVDGSAVEVIWAWMSESRRAKLVTVYFQD